MILLCKIVHILAPKITWYLFCRLGNFWSTIQTSYFLMLSVSPSERLSKPLYPARAEEGLNGAETTQETVKAELPEALGFCRT